MRSPRASQWRVLLLGLLAGCSLQASEQAGGGSPSATPAPVSAPSPKPTTPTYDLRHFEVSGSTALPQEAIDRIMADATGSGVTLTQLQRALVRLQEAYRERGLVRVAVRLPQQSLVDGKVRLVVDEGVESPVALKSWTVPTYDIRHFEVRGNSVLKAEELDALLSPVAGESVHLEQIQRGLSRLQEVYRERGYPQASVQLPPQLLTDGTVTVIVAEGAPNIVRAATPSTTVNPTSDPVGKSTLPPPTAPTFQVKRYEVIGNTLLRPEVIDAALTNATGSAVSLPQIQKALGELQLAYRERGYATVSVGLPQQQLTNAVVRVSVTEGRLTDIRVTGNRHFSSNNVVRALPSLRTNTLLNSRVFQRELDQANQNRDRQIYPTIGPGAEPGDTSLNLRVKDRFPLHGRVEVNNHSTPGTPDWRINASAQYNNLWQREHQLGLSYGFTPEAYKTGGLVADNLFNRPLIANYGAYYRLPFGVQGSVEDRIAASSGQFGYDESTRQFRLPPVGGRPEMTVFASASSSDTGLKYGPASIVSQTPLLTIVSRDSGQNLSINETVGGRLSVPIPLGDTKRLGVSIGPDLKRYLLESYNTNNFIITTVVTNSQGSQTIESVVSSPQPSRANEVLYLPLSIGFDFMETDRSGSFSANLSLAGNAMGGADEFGALAYSRDAKELYGKVTLTLTREQKLFHQWSLLARASGQTSTGPLLSTEQFAVGGLNSVRGYYEGDEYGDAGWFGSLEMRTPFLTGRVPTWNDYAPIWIRGSAFLDVGQRYLLDDPFGGNRTESLLGTGVGISANINNLVDLRVTIGWPLLDTANTPGRSPRAYFSLGGLF